MRFLEEVKNHLQKSCGVRWNEDYARQARNALSRQSTNTVEGALKLLNGETYFFRYPVYLQILRDRLISESGKRPGSAFRICSAGCSTGEEVYSIAFALQDAALEAGAQLQITGLDIRPEAIAIAKSGVYRNWSLRSRKPEVLESFLEWTGDGWKVREKYRKTVEFRTHNLLESLVIDKFDAMILCNVLLYMHESAVRTVYENISAVIEDNGILLIAQTDPPPEAPWRLQGEAAGWPVFARRVEDKPHPHIVQSPPVKKKTARSVPKLVTPPELKSAMSTKATGSNEDDHSLWKAWAVGELSRTAEIIRRKLFFEPEHPLWRYLNGVLMWENGWLRKSSIEIEKAETLLAGAPSDEMIAGLCTAEELRSLIRFWRQQHG